MEKPSQWVSKLCRLYFADEYARRTVGVPSATQVPDIETALKAVQKILPKLEARMIEFLAEWLVTFLLPATHVLEVRAPHLSFMFLKDYWFRELYLGLKVTASFDRSESYTRVIDGQVRCITPEIKPQNLQVIWNVQFITVFVPPWMIPPVYHRLRYPTYVCLPSGLYKARNGQIVAQTGSDQEIIPLPGIYFFDGWRVHPTLTIPSNLPRTKEAPVRDITHAAPSASTEPTRSPEEETRDILATAAKNQAGDGPNTRRAAVRACKYLRAMVNQYGSIIQEVHKAARIHTQLSKGTAGSTTQYRPQGGKLPVKSPELTSELLHYLSTLPDPGN